jgi:hypothetical protein
MPNALANLIIVPREGETRWFSIWESNAVENPKERCGRYFNVRMDIAC